MAARAQGVEPKTYSVRLSLQLSIVYSHQFFRIIRNMESNFMTVINRIE